MPDSPYSDIIDLPHHVSTDRPHLSMHQRAAQFSPFAALVGYSDVVEEMVRQTDPERELNEDEKTELDRRMGVIAANIVVTVEYFVPDSHKDGGEYLFKSGVFEKISPAERVVMVGGEVIRMDWIVGISSELFAEEF